MSLTKRPIPLLNRYQMICVILSVALTVVIQPMSFACEKAGVVRMSAKVCPTRISTLYTGLSFLTSFIQGRKKEESKWSNEFLKIYVDHRLNLLRNTKADLMFSSEECNAINTLRSAARVYRSRLVTGKSPILIPC